MSNLLVHAQRHPDKPAVVWGNGESVISYGELEARSRRLAHLFGKLGLQPGDGVAVLVANEDPMFDAFWAALRSGLYFTPLNWHLQQDEVQYIVDNCDARVFLASSRFAAIAEAIAGELPRVEARLATGGEIQGYRRLEDLLADVPEDPALDAQPLGATMLYSSGTTGYPKGVRTALSGRPFDDPAADLAIAGLMALFGFSPDDVYLSPAPLYHAAPLAFSTAQHRLGATTVAMRAFDAEEALRTIQDQRVTTSQWVPTHFRRLLQLPEATRRRYDVSSLRVAVHAAAPCPVPVKREMIEWWGPTLVEYYAGTEGGGTLIRSEDWLEHPGSVGRHWAGGTIHILDDDGAEVAPGGEGAIYFEAPPLAEARFAYHKDPDKTAQSYRGDLFTLGDVGYLDDDGYLFLTDRKSHMIISGGVNIYPLEVENHLSTHPAVDDVAVIGVPHEEMGEEVRAVVVPRAGYDPGPELGLELVEFCRAHIAHYKCPRSVDFVDALPRLPTGKLLKRRLRDRYWQDTDRRI